MLYIPTGSSLITSTFYSSFFITQITIYSCNLIEYKLICHYKRTHQYYSTKQEPYQTIIIFTILTQPRFAL